MSKAAKTAFLLLAGLASGLIVGLYMLVVLLLLGELGPTLKDWWEDIRKNMGAMMRDNLEWLLRWAGFKVYRFGHWIQQRVAGRLIDWANVLIEAAREGKE